ncbi:MAG: 2-keto-3-deoxygluconate kinase [Robiginitomaculum sp.]|nr:MAG: 2-keto-3-deoxygluconate kinase [Robiginitomaculum sp.]
MSDPLPLKKTVVCFGELLLRLGAPGHEILLQTGKLDVHYGGAEANVGVSLAQWGHEVRMASQVSDGPLGEAVLGALRRYGVQTRFVKTSTQRMGLYFISAGAVRRPSRIVYDRADSAFTHMDEHTLDWDAILDGADWLHISGITPATGAGPAKAAIAVAKRAVEAGVKLSFDGNYRAQLWQNWDGDGPAILREILSYADLAFINEKDVGLLLGRTFEDAEQSVQRTKAMACAFEHFPRLQHIANTHRQQTGVKQQTLSAQLFSRDQSWQTNTYQLFDVVDRIGTGDAFAAGILDGFMQGEDPQSCLDFALEAAIYKHSIAGDFNIASREDIRASGTGFDVRR